MKALKINILLVFLFTFEAIYSQQNLSKFNFAELYDLSKVKIHPQVGCYHLNDSISRIFTQIDLSEFKYSQMNNSAKYFAKANVKYEIYYNYKSTSFIDSGTVIITDSANYEKNVSKIFPIDIKLKDGFKYVIYFKITDANSENDTKVILEVDKKDRFNECYFAVIDKYNLPILNNIINKDQIVEIVSAESIRPEIKITKFKSINKVSEPPTSNNSSKIIKQLIKDSAFTMAMDNGFSSMMKFENQGIYFFQSDTAIEQGFSLYNFNQTYPFITTSLQMMLPLRYISTKEEFNKLLKNLNKKQAVDDFWIQISGSEDVAAEMIEFFYNRVQNANRYFTSDCEGWMTDRGMIYVVYGTPDYVSKDFEYEIWTYSIPNSTDKIEFKFNKVYNVLTNNDFVLERNAKYAESWKNALKFWRKK